MSTPEEDIDPRDIQYAQLIVLMREGDNEIAKKFWATMGDYKLLGAANEARAMDNLEMVQFFLACADASNDPHMKNNMVSQLMHQAAKHAQLDALDLLFPLAHDPLQKGILTASCEWGHSIEVVRKIIALGVDPHHTDQYPLHMAAVKGRLDIVEFLLEGAAPNSLDQKFIASAAKCGHLDVVEYLLPFTPKQHYLSALISASGQEQYQIVDLLYPLCDQSDLFLLMNPIDGQQPLTGLEMIRSFWENEHIKQAIDQAVPPAAAPKPKKI